MSPTRGSRSGPAAVSLHLSRSAAGRLQRHGIDNVTLEVGDAARGWTGGPYDVIAITGSLPFLPDDFRHLLNRGGRLFAVIGRPPVMEAVLVRRTGEDEWHEETLFETVLAPLVNAPEVPDFAF